MKFHGTKTRSLLNLPGHQTTAAIVTEIEDTARRPQENGYLIVPRWTFQMSNCDRSLSWELDGFHGSGKDLAERQANDLHKLDTMIQALTEFREGVAVEHRRYKRRLARRGR